MENVLKLFFGGGLEFFKSVIKNKLRWNVFFVGFYIINYSDLLEDLKEIIIYLYVFNYNIL